MAINYWGSLEILSVLSEAAMFIFLTKEETKFQCAQCDGQVSVSLKEQILIDAAR
jgi:hypothetical protein